MTQPSPTSMQALMDGPAGPGAITWIGLRPSRRAPVVAQSSALLVTARGIEGDRYDTKTNGARQVTLISAEALAAVASFLGRAPIAPELVRRNLLTRGINLLALKGRRFRVGDTLLEYSGECAPCSHMEEALGPGGYNAMRGQGGICARIIEGGCVRIGDPISRVNE